MRATVSVASSIALVETNKGCKTFSSRMFEIKPCSKVVQSVDATQYDTKALIHVSRSLLTFLTLIPAFFSPRACLFRNSVTIAIGFKPAFSASVVGMTSSASANAWKQ